MRQRGRSLRFPHVFHAGKQYGSSDRSARVMLHPVEHGVQRLARPSPPQRLAAEAYGRIELATCVEGREPTIQAGGLAQQADQLGGECRHGVKQQLDGDARPFANEAFFEGVAEAA